MMIMMMMMMTGLFLFLVLVIVTALTRIFGWSSNTNRPRNPWIVHQMLGSLFGLQLFPQRGLGLVFGIATVLFLVTGDRIFFLFVVVVVFGKGLRQIEGSVVKGRILAVIHI